MKKFEVYFANLGAYNAGNLVGGHVDIMDYVDDPDGLHKEIMRVTKNADEYAAHDYEGESYGLGESGSLSQFLAVAWSIDEYDADMTAAMAGHIFDYTQEAFQDMAEKLYMTCDSYEDLGFQYVEDTYYNLPNIVHSHLDFNGLGEEIAMDYTVAEGPSGIMYLFHG
tara:strand:- start:28203 stop:28703 length:501 start_codon:yes stop_codon:yes gene_type:complete